LDTDFTKLQEYLDAHYAESVFGDLKASGADATLYLHNHLIRSGRIKEDKKFDIIFFSDDGKEEEEIQKVIIKCLCPSDIHETVKSLFKVSNEVRAKGIDPIFSPGPRYHIKNKTLFPLMEQKQVLLFTLLEGEVLRGIVSGFTRYEITLSMKGGLFMTIFRHAIYDLRDKKGRCYLKKAVESRDGKL
jgi:sRNA-binding regulator protein Hfq